MMTSLQIFTASKHALVPLVLLLLVVMRNARLLQNSSPIYLTVAFGQNSLLNLSILSSRPLTPLRLGPRLLLRRGMEWR